MTFPDFDKVWVHLKTFGALLPAFVASSLCSALCYWLISKIALMIRMMVMLISLFSALSFLLLSTSLVPLLP